MQQSISLSEPSYVGRKAELDALQRSLKSTIDEKGSTVLISGAAGSGKTRLVKEFLDLARNEDIVVYLGWCLSNSNVPYFPFIEAFNSYPILDTENNSSDNLSFTSSKMVSYLTESLPMETSKQKLGVPLAWKDKTFLAIAKELLFISTAKPVVLILEDIHWADTASLALFHYLSRTINSERILIIGTFRSEDLLNEEEQHLANTLQLMSREALYNEIKLNELTLENIARIIESMLGGPIDQTFVQDMLKTSQGNPLFIIESLRMLAEDGNLFQEQGKWQVKCNIAIPYKVREIILRRLAILKPEESRILDVASVIGGKFDATLISSVLSIDRLIVLEILNRIFQKTFLLSVEDNIYIFDHSLSQEVIYQKISRPLKLGYHERIAEEMERKEHYKINFTNQIAYHYIQAENKVKAIEYSILAGKDALAKFSNLEAIRHFSWILQATSGDEEDLQNGKTALEGLGDAYSASNLFIDAIKTYERLAEISTGTVRQRSLVKAMYAAFFQGDSKLIEELVKKAEEESNLGRLEKARILHYKGVVATNQGKILEAIKLCEKSLSIFEEEHDLADAAWLLFVVADFASGQGEMEKAIAYCLRSLAIYDGLRDFRSMMEAYNEAGKVFFYEGLYPEAQKMFEKVLEIEQESKMGNYIMLAKANCFLSMVHEMTGDINCAIEKNLKAIEHSSKANSPLFLPIIYSNIVKQFTIKGELSKALEYDAKLKAIYTPSMSISNFYYVLSQIVLLGGMNQLSQSIERFEEYIAFFRKTFPNPNLSIIPLTYYAWVLEKGGQDKTAQKIKEEIQLTKDNKDQRLLNANAQTYFMLPTKVLRGHVFDGRIDIINVSKVTCLVDMSILLPNEFTVVAYSNNTKICKGNLALQKYQLEPFGVITVVFTLQPKKSGTSIITSNISFSNKKGTTAICQTQQSNIRIQEEEFLETPQTVKEVKDLQLEPGKIEFDSDLAEKAFNYLAKEFIKDYMQRRIVLEKSGWRSLVEIATNEKIPASSLYGYRNRRGQAIVELQRRGLVEKRFFPGERGRGGKILRLRVSYDKDFIKKYVDNQICCGKNNNP